MKQTKATVAEAEKLLRWLQKRDDAPPYNRTIHGYLLMLENCADPAKDYIDWKPGTSPQEIDALRQRAEKAEADNASLRAALNTTQDERAASFARLGKAVGGISLTEYQPEVDLEIEAAIKALRADRERLEKLLDLDVRIPTRDGWWHFNRRSDVDAYRAALADGGAK